MTPPVGDTLPAKKDFDVVDSDLASTSKGRVHADDVPQLVKCFGNDEKLACNPGIVSESTATSLHPCTEDVELETNLHAPSVDALVSKDSKRRSKFNDFVGEIMFQYFEKEDGGTFIPEFFTFEYDEANDLYVTRGGISGDNSYNLIVDKNGGEMLIHIQEEGLSASGLTIYLEDGVWCWSHGYKSLIMTDRFRCDFETIKRELDEWTLSTHNAHEMPAGGSDHVDLEVSCAEGEQLRMYSFEAHLTMNFILRDGLLVDEEHPNNFCVQSKDGLQLMWSDGMISTKFKKTSEHRIMNPSEQDWDSVVDTFYESHPNDSPNDTTELFQVAKKDYVFYTIGTLSGVHRYYMEDGQLHKADGGGLVRARLLANGDFQWSHGYHAKKTHKMPQDFRQVSQEEWDACLGKGFDTVDQRATVINSFTFSKDCNSKDGDTYSTKNSADSSFNNCKLMFGLLQDPVYPVFGELLECGTIRWSNGFVSIPNGKVVDVQEQKRTQAQWLQLDGLEFDTFGVSEDTGTMQLQDQFRLVYDYGNRSWVTYSSTSGVHRYQLEDGELVHAQFPVKGQLAFADDGEVTIAWSTGFSSRKSCQQSAFVRKSASDWDRLDGKEFLLFQQGQVDSIWFVTLFLLS